LHTVFLLVIWQASRGKYRWNKAGKVSLLLTNLPTEKNYQQIIHRQSISVYDPVGKLITNRIIVQILTKNSVGKYKNSGSGTWRI